MRLLPVWPKLARVAHTLPYDMTIISPYQRGTTLPAPRWQNLTIPTLVMVGGKSPAWLQHSARALTEALPNASHRVVGGQTHNVKAKALALPLEEFFAMFDGLFLDLLMQQHHAHLVLPRYLVGQMETPQDERT